MPGGRAIYSEWSLIYQLSPGYILLHGQSELIMSWPGDGQVIRRVLMVTRSVCHWVITIKSPIIASHKLISVDLSPLSLVAVQCPVRECEPGSRAIAEPGPGPGSGCLLGSSGQEPPAPSRLSVSTHEPQPMKFSGPANPCPAAGHPCHYPGQERWVGRQLGQRKLRLGLLSPNFKGSNLFVWFSL